MDRNTGDTHETKNQRGRWPNADEHGGSALIHGIHKCCRETLAARIAQVCFTTTPLPQDSVRPGSGTTRHPYSSRTSLQGCCTDPAPRTSSVPRPIRPWDREGQTRS